MKKVGNFIKIIFFVLFFSIFINLTYGLDYTAFLNPNTTKGPVIQENYGNDSNDFFEFMEDVTKGKNAYSDVTVNFENNSKLNFDSIKDLETNTNFLFNILQGTKKYNTINSNNKVTLMKKKFCDSALEDNCSKEYYFDYNEIFSYGKHLNHNFNFKKVDDFDFACNSTNGCKISPKNYYFTSNTCWKNNSDLETKKEWGKVLCDTPFFSKDRNFRDTGTKQEYTYMAKNNANKQKFGYLPNADIIIPSSFDIVKTVNEIFTPDVFEKDFYNVPEKKLKDMLEVYFGKRVVRKGNAFYIKKEGLTDIDYAFNLHNSKYLHWANVTPYYLANLWHPNYTTGVSPLKREIIINPKDYTELDGAEYNVGIIGMGGYFFDYRNNKGLTADGNKDIQIINKLYDGAKEKAAQGDGNASDKRGRVSGYVYPALIDENTFKTLCLGYGKTVEDFSNDINGIKIKKGKTIYEIIKGPGQTSKTEFVEAVKSCNIEITRTKEKGGIEGDLPVFGIFKSEDYLKENIHGYIEDFDKVKKITLKLRYKLFDNYKPIKNEETRGNFHWIKLMKFKPRDLTSIITIETEKAGEIKIFDFYHPIFKTAISTAGDKCFSQVGANSGNGDKAKCFDTDIDGVRARGIGSVGYLATVKSGNNLTDQMYDITGSKVVSKIDNSLYVINGNYFPKLDNSYFNTSLFYDTYVKGLDNKIQYFNGIENGIGVDSFKNGIKVPQPSIENLKEEEKDIDTTNYLEFEPTYIKRPRYFFRDVLNNILDAFSVNYDVNTIYTNDLGESVKVKDGLISTGNNYLTSALGSIYYFNSLPATTELKDKTLGFRYLFYKVYFDDNFAFTYNNGLFSEYHTKMAEDGSISGLPLIFDNAGVLAYQSPTQVNGGYANMTSQKGLPIYFQFLKEIGRYQEIFGLEFLSNRESILNNLLNMYYNSIGITKKNTNITPILSLFEFDTDNYRGNKKSMPYADTMFGFFGIKSTSLVPFMFPSPVFQNQAGNRTVQCTKAWECEFGLTFNTTDYRPNFTGDFHNIGALNNTSVKKNHGYRLQFPYFLFDYKEMPLTQKELLLSYLNNNDDDTVINAKDNTNFRYTLSSFKGLAGYFKDSSKTKQYTKISTNQPSIENSYNQRNKLKLTEGVDFYPIGNSGNSFYRFFNININNLLFEPLMVTKNNIVVTPKYLPFFKGNASGFENLVKQTKENYNSYKNIINQSIIHEVETGVSMGASVFGKKAVNFGPYSVDLEQTERDFTNKLFTKDTNKDLSILLSKIYTILNPKLGNQFKGVMTGTNTNFIAYAFSCEKKKLTDGLFFKKRIATSVNITGTEKRFVNMPAEIEGFEGNSVFECKIKESGSNLGTFTLFKNFALPYYSNNELSLLPVRPHFNEIFNLFVNDKDVYTFGLNANGTVIVNTQVEWEKLINKNNLYLKDILKEYYKRYFALTDENENVNVYFTNFDTNDNNGLVYNYATNLRGFNKKERVINYFSKGALEDINFDERAMDGKIGKMLKIQKIKDKNGILDKGEGTSFDKITKDGSYYLSLANLNNSIFLKEILFENQFYEYNDMFTSFKPEELQGKIFKNYNSNNVINKLSDDFSKKILETIKKTIESNIDADFNDILDIKIGNIEKLNYKYMDNYSVSNKSIELEDNILMYIRLKKEKYNYDILVPFFKSYATNEKSITNKNKDIVRVLYFPADIYLISKVEGKNIRTEIFKDNSEVDISKGLTIERYNLNALNVRSKIETITNNIIPKNPKTGDTLKTELFTLKFSDLKNEILYKIQNLKNDGVFKVEGLDFFEKGNPNNTLYKNYKVTLEKLTSMIFRDKGVSNKKYVVKKPAALFFIDFTYYKLIYKEDVIRDNTNTLKIYNKKAIGNNSVGSQENGYETNNFFKRFTDNSTNVEMENRDNFEKEIIKESGSNALYNLDTLLKKDDKLNGFILHTTKLVPFTNVGENEDFKQFRDGKKNITDADKYKLYTINKIDGDTTAEAYWEMFTGFAFMVDPVAQDLPPEETPPQDVCRIGIVYTNEDNHFVNKSIYNGVYTHLKSVLLDSDKVILDGKEYNSIITNSPVQSGNKYPITLSFFITPGSPDTCNVDIDKVLLIQENLNNSDKIWEGTSIPNVENKPVIKEITSKIPLTKGTVIKKTFTVNLKDLNQKYAKIGIQAFAETKDSNKYRIVSNKVDLKFKGMEKPNDPGCNVCYLAPVVPSSSALYGLNYVIDLPSGTTVNPIVQLVCNNQTGKDIVNIKYRIEHSGQLQPMSKKDEGFNIIGSLKNKQTIQGYGGVNNEPLLVKRYLFKSNTFDINANLFGTYQYKKENGNIVSCNLNNINYLRQHAVEPDPDGNRNTLQCYLTKQENTEDVADFDYSKGKRDGHIYFKLYKRQNDIINDPMNQIGNIPSFKLSKGKYQPSTSSEQCINKSLSRDGGHLWVTPLQGKAIGTYNKIYYEGKIILPKGVTPNFDITDTKSLFKGLEEQSKIAYSKIKYDCTYKNKTGNIRRYTKEKTVWYSPVYDDSKPTQKNIHSGSIPSSTSGYEYSGCQIDIELGLKQSKYGLNGSLTEKTTPYNYFNIKTTNSFASKKTEGFVIGPEILGHAPINKMPHAKFINNLYSFFDDPLGVLEDSPKDLFILQSNKPFIQGWIPIKITKTLSSSNSTNTDGTGTVIGTTTEKITCDGTLKKNRIIYTYMDTSKFKKGEYYGVVASNTCGRYTRDLRDVSWNANLSGYNNIYSQKYNYQDKRIGIWKTRSGTCSCGFMCVMPRWELYYDTGVYNGYFYPTLTSFGGFSNIYGPNYGRKKLDDDAGKGNGDLITTVLKIPENACSAYTPITPFTEEVVDKPADDTTYLTIGTNNWTQIIGDFQVNKTEARKDKIVGLVGNNELLKEGVGNIIMKDYNNDYEVGGNKIKNKEEFLIPLTKCYVFDHINNKYVSDYSGNYKTEEPDKKGECKDGTRPLFYRMLTEQTFNQLYLDENQLTSFNANEKITFDKDKYTTFVFNNEDNINTQKPFFGAESNNETKVDGIGTLFFTESIRSNRIVNKTELHITSNIVKENPKYSLNKVGEIDKKNADGIIISVNGDVIIGKNVSLIEGVLIVNGDLIIEDSKYQLNIFGKLYVSGKIVNKRKSTAYSEKDILTKTFERPSVRVTEDPMWDLLTDMPILSTIQVEKENYKKEHL